MWWFGTFLLDFYLNCFVFPFCVVVLCGRFHCHITWLRRELLSSFWVSFFVCISVSIFSVSAWFFGGLAKRSYNICTSVHTLDTMFSSSISLAFHFYPFCCHLIFHHIDCCAFVHRFFFCFFCTSSTHFSYEGLDEFLLGQHLPKINSHWWSETHTHTHTQSLVQAHKHRTTTTAATTRMRNVQMNSNIKRFLAKLFWNHVSDETFRQIWVEIFIRLHCFVVFLFFFLLDIWVCFVVISRAW